MQISIVHKANILLSTFNAQFKWPIDWNGKRFIGIFVHKICRMVLIKIKRFQSEWEAKSKCEASARNERCNREHGTGHLKLKHSLLGIIDQSDSKYADVHIFTYLYAR